MMAVEAPFLGAIIARLPGPTENLAAWGVSVAFALIIESPVIMLLSAATAMVRDKTSYVALRRFTYTLNILLTAVMVLVLIPPVFRFLTGTLLNLPSNVAQLTYGAMVLLLPWPTKINPVWQRNFIRKWLIQKKGKPYSEIFYLRSQIAPQTGRPGILSMNKSNLS